MSETKTEPIVTTLLPAEDDLDHWVCCEETDVTLCGRDARNLIMCEDMEKASCNICEVAHVEFPERCPVKGACIY